MKNYKSIKRFESFNCLDHTDMPPELQIKRQEQFIVNLPDYRENLKDFRQFSSLSNVNNDSSVYKLSN